MAAGDSITAATKGAGMAAAEILFVDHLEELKDLESLRPIRHRKEASL